MPDLDLIRAFRDDVTDDPAAEAAARDRLRTHIAASGRRRRRPGRRAGITLAAFLLVSGTAAAAGLLLTGDDLDLGTVACLDTARTLDAGSGRAVFVEPGPDPVSACAPLWRAGQIDGRRHAEAPDLVACAAPGRPVVVVPGRAETCRGLGLEPLPADFPAAAADLGRAKAVLLRDGDLHRPRSACDDPAAIADRARGLLARAGVEGVPVELTGSGPCAGVYGFAGGRAVTVERLSRAAAAEYREHREIGLALDPLLAGRRACADPRAFAARARERLDAAGLAGVRVRVEARGGPCVDLGGYAFGEHEVVFSRTAP